MLLRGFLMILCRLALNWHNGGWGLFQCGPIQTAPLPKNGSECAEPDRQLKVRFGKLVRMSTIIIDIDLVGDKVLVTFGDGTATMFNAQFLYVHRRDEGNETLPAEPDRD
jgi:hypothetical protein